MTSTKAKNSLDFSHEKAKYHIGKNSKLFSLLLLAKKDFAHLKKNTLGYHKKLNFFLGHHISC